VAWWGVVAWFLQARYLGWQHVAMFVAGLGLGLVARELLATERTIVLTSDRWQASNGNGHAAPDDVTAPLHVVR
jgi:hypothetical protein